MPHSVIYVRISDAKQIGNTSLAEQERVCRAWCAVQGFDVDRIFVDEAESAKTANRPQFLQMLHYVESSRGKVGHICVWRFDRFARNLEDDVVVRLRLKESGITLHSATERTDSSPSGKLLARVVGAASEYENDVRSLRTVSGMRARAEAGRFVWFAPTGYLNTGRGGHGLSMTPDPERGPLITKLFDIAASGAHRQYELLEQSRKLGLTSKRTGGPLTLDTLKSLLTNPAYTGRLVSRSFGKDVAGDWLPLVDESTFSRVQAVLRGKVERIAPEPRRVDQYPLRGFALCAQCNLPLTASQSKGGAGGRYRYYHCHRSAGHLRTRADKVETDFVTLLDSLTPRPGQAALMEEIFRRTWDTQNRGNVSDADALAKTLASIERRKERLLHNMEEGILSDEDFRPRYEQLNTQIHATRERLSAVTRDSLDVDTAIDYLSHLLWNAQILWGTSDLDTKQRLQRAIFPNGLKYASDGGFGTVSNEFFQLLPGQSDTAGDVVTLGRFELPTCGLGNRTECPLHWSAGARTMLLSRLL
jgi:site-specific DNA recombinase